jgi:hypothetical protein
MIGIYESIVQFPMTLTAFGAPAQPLIIADVLGTGGSS